MGWAGLCWAGWATLAGQAVRCRRATDDGVRSRCVVVVVRHDFRPPADHLCGTLSSSHPVGHPIQSLNRRMVRAVPDYHSKPFRL